MKWQNFIYRFLDHKELDTLSYRLEVFNNLGNDEWELASVDNGIAYFKRPLRTKSEDEIMKHFDYPQRDRSSLV